MLKQSQTNGPYLQLHRTNGSPMGAAQAVNGPALPLASHAMGQAAYGPSSDANFLRKLSWDAIGSP